MTRTETTTSFPSDLFAHTATRSPQPDRASRERYQQVLTDLRVARIHPAI